jgi:hypothetical protein
MFNPQEVNHPLSKKVNPCHKTRHPYPMFYFYLNCNITHDYVTDNVDEQFKKLIFHDFFLK